MPQLCDGQSVIPSQMKKSYHNLMNKSLIDRDHVDETLKLCTVPKRCELLMCYITRTVVAVDIFGTADKIVQIVMD